MSESVDSVLLAFGPKDREHVQRLLDVALQLAEPTGATLYIQHVFPQEEYDDLIDQLDVSPDAESFGPSQLAARHEAIRTPAEQLDEREIDYEIRGAVGAPDTKVVRTARNLEVDRVFIGGRGRSPTGKAMFGDYAQQVLLNAPCPVTYVRRE